MHDVRQLVIFFLQSCKLDHIEAEKYFEFILLPSIQITNPHFKLHIYVIYNVLYVKHNYIYIHYLCHFIDLLSKTGNYLKTYEVLVRLLVFLTLPKVSQVGCSKYAKQI